MTQSIQIIMVGGKVVPENTIKFLTEVYSSYKGKIFAPFKLGIVPFLDLKGMDFSKTKEILGKNPGVFSMRLFKGRFDLEIEYETKPPRVAITSELRSVFNYWFNEVDKHKEYFNEFIEFCRSVMILSGASYFFAGIDEYGDFIEMAGNVNFLYCKEREYVKLMRGFVKNRFKAKLSEEEVKNVVNESASQIKREGEWIFINFMHCVGDVFPVTKIAEALPGRARK